MKSGGLTFLVAAWMLAGWCHETVGAETPANQGATARSDGDKSSPASDVRAAEADRRINFPKFPDVGNLFRDEPLIGPTMPEVRRPRTQTEIDQEENWVFMTPEDAVRNVLINDADRLPDIGPDGRDRNTFSALERFMDRQARASAGSPLSDLHSLDLAPMAPLSDFNNPLGIPDMNLNPYPNSASLPGMEVLMPQSGTLANPLNVPSYGNAQDLERQYDLHQKQIDAYKRLLDSAPPVAATPQPTPTGIPSPFATPAPSPSPFATPTVSPAFGSPFTPGIPAVSGEADVTQPARGRPAQPTRPDFTPPQRAF